MADFNFFLNRQGIQGRKGEKGDTGFSPTISVGTDTLDEYKLIIANESNSFETPNLRGNINISDNGGTYLRYDTETKQISAQSMDAATADTLGGVRLSTEADIVEMGTGSVVTPSDVADALPLYLEGEGAVTITQDELTSKTKIKVDVPSVNDLESRMSTAEAEIADIQTDVANLNNNKVAKTDLATTESAGIVKVDGTSITVSGDGTISASPSGALPIASTTQLGGVKVDGTSIIADENGVISSVGGSGTGDVTASGNNEFTGENTFSKSIRVNNSTDPYQNTFVNYNGIGIGTPTEAEINAHNGMTPMPLKFIASKLTLSSAIDGSSESPIITSDKLKAGENITLNKNAETGDITISSTGGGGGTGDVPIATTTTAGKVKPDGTTITITDDGTISANSSYTLPTASTTQLGGVKVDGTSVTINSDGVISAAGGGGAPTNMVTTDTDQDITGMKTIVNSDGLCFKSTNSLATSVTARIVNVSSSVPNTIGKVTISPDKSSGSRNGFASISYGILNDGNSNYPLYGKGGLQVTPVVDDTNAEARILLGNAYNGMGNIVGTTSGLTIGTGTVGSELSITSTDITFNGQSLLNSGGEAPTNMVTTDTDQTINGSKTFANGTGTTFKGTSSNSNSLTIDGDDKEIRFNSANQSDAVIKNQGWNSANLNIGTNFNSVKITTTLYDKNGNEIVGGGGSTPENMVTTDTNQIITGAKTFTNSITFNNTLNMSTANTDTLYIYSSGSYAAGYTTDIDFHKNLNINGKLGGGTITLAPSNSSLNALKYRNSDNTSNPSYDVLHTGNLVAGDNITIGEPNSTGVRTISGPSNEYMASMAFPSTKYVNLNLGASGATYTAPADGYFCIAKRPTATGQHIYMGLNSGSPSVTTNSFNNTTHVQCYMPCKKGNACTISYSADGELAFFRFVYAEGSQPTA